jgi:hypothetical protein
LPVLTFPTHIVFLYVEGCVIDTTKTPIIR